MHEEQKANLTLLLESEQWKPTDVPSELQKLVDDIVFSGKYIGVKDLLIDFYMSHQNHFLGVVYLWFQAHLTWIRIPVMSQSQGSHWVWLVKTSLWLGMESWISSPSRVNWPAIPQDWILHIVFCDSVVLLLVKIMSSYSVYAKHCQFLTPDLLSRLAELLQFYNSRVCQLLLGECWCGYTLSVMKLLKWHHVSKEVKINMCLALEFRIGRVLLVYEAGLSYRECMTNEAMPQLLF